MNMLFGVWLMATIVIIIVDLLVATITKDDPNFFLDALAGFVFAVGLWLASG